MTTINVVDPELVPPFGQIPSPNFRMATLSEVRASLLAKAIAALPAASLSVLTETVSVPGRQGAPDVRVLAYRPANVQVHFRYCSISTIPRYKYVLLRREKPQKRELRDCAALPSFGTP